MGIIKVGTFIGVILGLTAYTALSVIGASLELEMSSTQGKPLIPVALDVKPSKDHRHVVLGDYTANIKDTAPIQARVYTGYVQSAWNVQQQ